MDVVYNVRSHGVMVSTLDFESSDPSSNLGRTSHNLTPWRNGSASDSRSEGCVFESRRGQNLFLTCRLWHFCPDIVLYLVRVLLMPWARCPIVLRIFKARRPLTSSVRCIDGVCWWGRVFSKHSSGSIHQCLGAEWANCNLQWEPGSPYRLKRGKLKFEFKTFLIDNCAI